MNRRQALHQTRGLLTENNIEDASIEAELLLRHALKVSRAELYTNPTHELSPEEEETLKQLVNRRLNGEPSAYITGHREFYGLDFEVNPAVLIPRPESELLVEKAINLARSSPITTIADIGTGCGAIAISLALNLPGTRIYATDISAPALEVAQRNCRKHGVTNSICLLHGDMVDPLPEPVDLIVANLPYVKAGELPPTGEPALALNGGAEGLDKIAKLCRKIDGRLNPPGWVLLEIGQGQGKAVTALLRRLFPTAEIDITPDLSGIERVLSLRLTTSHPRC